MKNEKGCEVCCGGWVAEEIADKQVFRACMHCNMYEAVSTELQNQKKWFRSIAKDLMELRSLIESRTVSEKA